MNKSWGLTDKILTGQKTIESRWYKNRYAPWGKIKTGETVFFKNSGQPVALKAKVHKIIQIGNLTPVIVGNILNEYGARIGLSETDLPHYNELFKDKMYCLLIFLCDTQAIKPFQINKDGYGAMSSWISVTSVRELKKL